MRFIKNWEIDIFAVPITLNHKGREKAKSLHGTVLTFLITSFIGWLAYSLGKEMFSRQNPNTITFDTFKEIPDPLELNKETFPFAIGMQLPTAYNLAYFIDEEVYVPIIKLLVFTDVKGSNGSITKQRKTIDVDIEPCTVDHFGSAKDSVKTLPLSSMYCVKPEQTNLAKIELEGKEDFSTYKAFYIGIQKCTNTDTKTCKSDTEISEKLTRSWVNIIYLQAAINPQNFTFPNQRFATGYTTMLSPSILKSGIIRLNHLQVVDDDGWLFESKNVKSYIKVDTPVENLDLEADPTGLIYSGVFELGQVTTTYERQYTRIQTVLAQIQASAATVVLVLIIILRPYSKVKFQEALINELFDVKMKKKEIVKSNRNAKKKKAQAAEQAKESPKIIKTLSRQGSKTVKQEVTEENNNGFLSSESDRPLKASRNKSEETTKIQSFQKLLTSIEGSPELAPSQKSSENLRKHLFLDRMKREDSAIEAAKISDNRLGLAIEKPEKLKLEALARRVSDGPRKVSELSFHEKEEDRTSGSPVNNQKDYFISPPMSPQNGLVALEMENLKPEEEEEETQEEEEDALNYESKKIDISIWEFFMSYIKKTVKTREKFTVLDRGMKNVKERMDILNIMKKFRELDKLKALLLEEDQLILFNAMPKAEIRSDESEISTNELLRSRSFSQRIIKKSTFIEMNEKQELVKQSYDAIQMRCEKSKIDLKLMELYNDMLSNKNSGE